MRVFLYNAKLLKLKIMSQKTISKQDAKQMAERFYDFYDKVWLIVKEMLKMRNLKHTNEEISLVSYHITRHDKNIIEANYYSSFTSSYNIQFPLSYLYDENWQDDYKNKLLEEKQRIAQSIKQQTQERDLKEIKRLKELYPEEFNK